MKKLTLLFIFPALVTLMVSCGGGSESSSQSGDTSTSETSESSEDKSSESTSEKTSSESGTSQSQTSESTTSTSTSKDSSSEEEPKTQTYNFYIDYSHSDSAYYTMMWWNGRPLGTCPEECLLTSEDAPDEAYPTFLGWSKYSSAQDESQLWDFSKDASLNKTVSLYGIWVSE